jgi:EspG family
VLAAPDEECTLRWDSAAPFRLLAARRGHLHVVAGIVEVSSRNDGTSTPAFHIGWGTPGPLSHDIVAMLPPCQPAKLRSQSVRLASLVRAGGKVRSNLAQAKDQPMTFYREELRALGEPHDASTAFARLADGTPSGRGELGVAVRTGNRRLTTGHKLVVNDIMGERYLVITKDGYVTVRGADNPALLNELDRQSTTLRGQSTR